MPSSCGIAPSGLGKLFAMPRSQERTSDFSVQREARMAEAEIRGTMAKSKTSGIYFKVTDEERSLIEQRMALMGVHNMSAYIRKMCIDGYIVQLQSSVLLPSSHPPLK